MVKFSIVVCDRIKPRLKKKATSFKIRYIRLKILSEHIRNSVRRKAVMNNSHFLKNTLRRCFKATFLRLCSLNACNICCYAPKL